MADAIAQHIQGGVAAIFTILQLVRFDVGIDLAAPDRVERPDEGQVALADGDLRGRFGQREVAAAAEEIEEDGLDTVVGVVAEENLAAAVGAAEIGEEAVARGASCGLDGKFFCFRQGADILLSGLEMQLVASREFFDEAGVCGGFAPAQGVVEVADDEFFEPGGVEKMEEGDTVAAAGDADEVFPIWREVL